MSLSDVTRNCFLNGYPPSKWFKLCRLMSEKEQGIPNEVLSVHILNSVLLLCPSYTGHPDLKQYLEVAAQNIPLYRFVSTFLQASRSIQLHSPVNLHLLCTIALRTHYTSGLSPLGSLVSFTDSQIEVFTIIQDALSLVRIVHGFPESPSCPVVHSSSELLVLLLSCITDLSQIPTGQALAAFATANGLLHVCRQNFKLTNVVENLAMSLSLLLGDDAKMEQEVQIMHQAQMGLGRGESLVPSSSADIVTLSLILHDMVIHRTSEYGAGSRQAAASTLVAIFRWNTHWTPAIFYTQLMVSVLACLTQASAQTALVWISFIVTRLPDILKTFEQLQTAESPHSVDWRSALQLALTPVTRSSEHILRCNIIYEMLSKDTENGDRTNFSFSQAVLQNYAQVGLIEASFAHASDPNIPLDTTPGLVRQAQEASLDLEVYIEGRLIDHDELEFTRWAKRLWFKELSSHALFAGGVQKRFTRLANASDLEPLGHLCILLVSNDFLLELLALHLKIQEILVSALLLLDNVNCETVGDPQSAFTQIGQIIHFSQVLIFRFNLNDESFASPNGPISADFLRSPPRIYPPQHLSLEETNALNGWYKVLFDLNSEGIADSILRVTSPKTLLKIVPTLLFTVVANNTEQDVINNGIAFFLTPLLNWLLPTVVKSVSRELGQFSPQSMVPYFHIFRHTVTSGVCPKTTLLLCRTDILDVLRTLISTGQSMNTTALYADALKIYEKLKITLGFQVPPAKGLIWQERGFQPRVILREAFRFAKTGKAPSINVQHCLLVVSPVQFLQAMWSEMTSSEGHMAAPNPTDLDIWKRLSTYILTYPRPATVPPLFPVFFHRQVPSILLSMDRGSMQSLALTILVTTISSALIAGLQTELALRGVVHGGRSVLGESVSTTARKTANFLRGRKRTSQNCSEVLRQLNLSQAFVGAFPAFMDTDTTKGSLT